MYQIIQTKTTCEDVHDKNFQFTFEIHLYMFILIFTDALGSERDWQSAKLVTDKFVPEG